MESTGFLSDFSAVSAEDWERSIRATVAGPEHASKLVWHPEEELSIKPYYRAGDLKELRFIGVSPGQFPYVRSSRATANWRIREAIEEVPAEKANRLAVDAIGSGAEEIEFQGVSIESGADLALLLANLNQIPVRLCGLDERTARVTADWFQTHPHSSDISADINPLADLSFSAELCNIPMQSRLFTISSEDHEEKGAGAIEQVAFMLSAAVEFLDAMLERGVCINRAAKELGFSFAIGPNFLVEIAKLRAFRLAWARVVESFGADTGSAKPVIFARTAHWNETVYDAHVNVLRATTEALSAVFGGADSLAVRPFDACYRHADQDSRRLARSVQLILKHEAEFTRVADPLGGAYAIEALTHSIATKAWKIFQELETAGGFRKAQADGVIDSLIERRAAHRDASTNRCRLALIGTNRFANPGETALDRVDARRPKQAPRVARDFEEIRFRTERAAIKGKVPQILLGQFGDSKSRAARTQFAAEFLACAGLTGNVEAVQTPQELADSDAELIVLCSSDSEYLQFVDELMPLLAKRGSGVLVVVAGNPECAEELKRNGIAEFIHLRSDAVEVLTHLQQKLGIEG